MPPTILRDSEAMKKLFEAILESPNGKRTLSRLARTCRAFCEPALSVLWRELDSLIPIIGLFPGHTLKKARKPGMGFANTPSEDDWTVVLQYSDRVRQITYNEGANNVPASILQVLEDSRPRTYILPRLREVHWKAQTSAGLDRCAMFLSPDLRVVNLEIGTKIPQLNAFLADMSSRTKLASFSFSSPTSLPDAFTELLGRQDMLEKIVLVAPGALSPEIGRWLASLPYLKNLQLDLTGRSAIAVEGFFDELRPRSGDSTPSSVGSTDSGVFSEDDVDFSEIRKSLLRLTEESLPSKGFFAPMRKLVLTGDVSNIAVFVKHITSSLTQLELIIEDPPQRADWYELSDMICDRFSDSLESLRITATGSSRFNDLVRSTSRAEPPTGRLSFEHLTYLPNLIRLEIDLPESVVFIASDIEYLANACPRLETAKLCPLARFPPATSAPKITLNSVAHLITKCPRLHTLAVVIDAHGTPEILSSRQTSSRSLLRLHVGHSWIDDGLQVATFLSHMTPRLESLKYFQEKNRPGFIEAHARKWQKVAEYLPHLQSIRVSEKELSLESHKPAPRETRDKSVEAIVSTADQSVHVFPSTADASVQFSPLRILVDQSVESKPTLLSASVDARPATLDIGVEALTTLVDQGVDASPPTASVAVEAKIDELGITKAVQAILTPTTFSQSPAHQHQHLKALLYIPSIFGFLSFAYRFFIHYPLSIPSRLLDTTMAVAHFQWRRPEISEPLKPTSSDSVPPASDVSLDALHVRQ